MKQSDYVVFLREGSNIFSFMCFLQEPKAKAQREGLNESFKLNYVNLRELLHINEML